VGSSRRENLFFENKNQKSFFYLIKFRYKHKTKKQNFAPDKKAERKLILIFSLSLFENIYKLKNLSNIFFTYI